MSAKIYAAGFVILILAIISLGAYQVAEVRSLQDLSKRVDAVSAALQAGVQTPTALAPTGTPPIVTEQPQPSQLSVQDQLDVLNRFMAWYDLTDGSGPKLPVWRTENFESPVLPGYLMQFDLPYDSADLYSTSTKGTWSVEPPNAQRDGTVSISVVPTSAATTTAVTACNEPFVTPNGPSKPSVVTVNGLRFCKSSFGDCGAGSCGSGSEYDTIFNNKLVSIVTNTYGTTCGSVDEVEGCPRFNDAILEHVAKSFTIQPTSR